MTSLAEKIIEDNKKSQNSVTVDRLIPATIDNHLLTIYDDNVIDSKKPVINRARDATQMIINDIFQNLETEQIDGMTYAVLPTTQKNIMLPREKPVPAKKAKTKWEKFAETKGIKKKKQSRMVYDEETKQYIPRWGYKSKQNQKDREWAIEVPEHIDQNTDMFAKRNEEKKKRTDKNEFNRLRNIARNSGHKKADPTKLGINPVGGGSKDDLNRNFHVAKKATASMGKFDNKVAGEEQTMREKGKKRKFYDATGNSKNNVLGATEKERFLNIASDIQNGGSILNAKKAAGRLTAGQQGVRGEGKKKAKLAAAAASTKGKIGMKGKAKKAQRAGRNGKK